MLDLARQIFGALFRFFGTWPGAFVLGGLICALWWGSHVSSVWSARYQAREKELIAANDRESARRVTELMNAQAAAAETARQLEAVNASLATRLSENAVEARKNDAKPCLDRAAAQRVRRLTKD